MPEINLQQSPVNFGTSGVRGLVSELSAELCYAYAQAFWKSSGSGDLCVLGTDLRPSSESIASAILRALNDLDVEVVYVGPLATPAIAYFAQTHSAPAVVVTGSHIPFDRNGIKFYTAQGEISKAHEQMIVNQNITVPDPLELNPLPEVNRQAYERFLERYLAPLGSELCSGLTLAVYQHSSVARDFLVDLFTAMGAKVVQLGRSDQFVPIDTEAVRDEDKSNARKWAQSIGFDLLVSTDGDADRPLVADEQGNFFRGDQLGVLTAHALGISELVTPVSSNTNAERSEWFTSVTRTRIGSPYVIEAMGESGKGSGRVAGYEANGGFLLGSDIEIEQGTLERLPTRDAVLPMLALILLARKQRCSISQLRALLPERYTASDRITEFPTQASRTLLAELDRDSDLVTRLVPSELGELISVDQTDGHRMEFQTGDIVHLRPSGNAPELRCYSESDDERRSEELCAYTLERVKAWYAST